MWEVSNINLAITAAGLAISFIGLAEVLADSQMRQKLRTFFIVLFSVLICYVFADMFALISESRVDASWAAVTRISIFIESATSAVLMIMLSGLIQSTLGKRRWLDSWVFRTSLILLAVYIGLLIYTQFSTEIYVVTDQNDYERGPLYPILLVSPVLIMLVNLLEIWDKRRLLTGRQQAYYVAYLLIPAVAMVIQMLFYGVNFIVLGTAIASLMLLLSIMSEQMESYRRQRLEMEKLKSDLVLSQIQPHFLCNTLGAIGDMCMTAPADARDSLDKFSRYLRENINAAAHDDAVPFEHELEHTLTYLELEQLRFGEDLKVKLDIECHDFLIPTLMLQPLAENAVRHGIRGTEDGTGTVTLETREQPDCWEVSVIDDGAGFDPAAPLEDGRPHIGLDSARRRLQSIRNGQLLIDSAIGSGTRVTIVLPKERHKA